MSDRALLVNHPERRAVSREGLIAGSIRVLEAFEQARPRRVARQSINRGDSRERESESSPSRLADRTTNQAGRMPSPQPSPEGRGSKNKTRRSAGFTLGLLAERA